MKSAILVSALLLSLGAAHAARPLLVDSTNINEKGAGHVEAWVEKNGSEKTLNIAPVYAITSRLELGLSYVRDQPYSGNATSVSAKYVITPPQDKGCNTAASVFLGRASGDNVRGLNLIGSCSLGGPDIHVNLGASRNSGEKNNVRTFGVAVEQTFQGIAYHLEGVATEHEKPIFQIGARKELSKTWQLDGSVGRQGNQNRFSLGTKYQF